MKISKKTVRNFLNMRKKYNVIHFKDGSVQIWQGTKVFVFKGEADDDSLRRTIAEMFPEIGKNNCEKLINLIKEKEDA